MCALALYSRKLGKKISGSDCNFNNHQLLEKLTNEGIFVYFNHSKKNIKLPDLIVFSDAISKNNCELKYCKSLNIPCISRGEYLGYLSKQYNNCIAICGSHGKTTTSALISYIFHSNNLHPTVHIGGISNNFNSNFVLGEKEIFITEACEYKKNFLNIFPTHTVITNIDKDHMDCYKDVNDLKRSFYNFSKQTSQYIIYNGDKIEADFFKEISAKIISFGFNKQNNYYIRPILSSENNFRIYKNNKKYFEGTSKLLGEFNLLNILSAFIIADLFKIEKNKIFDSIKEFSGVKRRYEFIKKIGKSDVYADYAHHPNEIKELLKSCKQLKYDKIIVVFQPHTYSRTITLFTEFINCFDDCDELILIPTYSAREKPINGGKSEDLFNEIKKIRPKTYFFNNYNKLKNHLNAYNTNNNLILLVGAGDIIDLYK